MSEAGLGIISRMLDQFGADGASDIHLTSDRGAYVVKDKTTRPITGIDKGACSAMLDALVDHVVPNGLAVMSERHQAGASFDQGGQYRGRLAIREEQGGRSGTIRIISRSIPTPKELGLPAAVVQLMTRPSGLILYVGQTGSGKSSSIAAMTNLVHQQMQTAIYTLESPIEYLYPEGKSLVIQREVGTHVNSFAEGIEDAKRSHPRIIVVGEILNTATARSALLAAASGHLVISTMHAGTAAEAVDSFTSMFTPEEQGLIRAQMAQSLVAIVAQKLIPRIGGGLALAQEIAFNTSALAEVIRGSGDRGNDTKFIQQLLLGSGTKDGMVAMEESLARLVHSQNITLESARSEARDPKALVEKLTQLGIAA